MSKEEIEELLKNPSGKGIYQQLKDSKPDGKVTDEELQEMLRKVADIIFSREDKNPPLTTLEVYKNEGWFIFSFGTLKTGVEGFKMFRRTHGDDWWTKVIFNGVEIDKQEFFTKFDEIYGK